MATDDYAAIEAAFCDRDTDDAVSRLSEPRRLRLRDYWKERANGELTTALSFEFMLEDLRVEGAPAPLLDLAASAVAEENVHSDWCARWAVRLGHDEPRARLRGTRPLTFDGASEHDHRLLRTVFGGCFSETVAVHALDASQGAITLPSVRSMNQRHVKDEVRHARLGWALLAWEGVTARDRGMIAERVPELAALTREVWLASLGPADEALHAMGLLSEPMARAAFDDALESVILPGLEHHRVTRGSRG